MTTTQFVQGLKEGTVGIDAVFIFFQQHLSKLTVLIYLKTEQKSCLP